MSHFLERHAKLQTRVNDLITDVARNVELNDAAMLRFSFELCDIYSDQDFRHSYWEISTVVEGLSPDQRDALCESLRGLQQKVEDVLADRTEPKDIKNFIRQRISKLCDHVDLECLRLGRIDRVEHIGQEANDALRDAGGKLKETEERANALDSRVSDYHAQSISILGIFSGLVITFSSVIQFSASSMTNISDTDAYKITYFVCLAFFFLFNTIFMLMYSISKLSGKSIATDCRRMSCVNCRHCKSIFGRLRKKYPYVFWFNLVGVVFVGGTFFLATR